MVGRVDPAMQDGLVKLLLAISEGHGRQAADIAIGLGRRLDGFDADGFRQRAAALVAENQSTSMEEIQAGSVIADLTRCAGESGLRLPVELTMLGKALLNLDEVARKLDPDFDPTAAIRGASSELMRKKLLQTASPTNVMAAAMEAKEFAEQLPGRVNQVMDALAEGNLTLNVQGIDERDIMRSFQKLANRITAGTILAALIIGAALIMRVDTDPKLFGYPALAIVLFLVAAAAALVLLGTILLSDLPQRKRRD
jgi:predicted unusual protein kinase regulating ubiquinone biosynthesis (AarF/ABC1/UbiB family)